MIRDPFILFALSLLLAYSVMLLMRVIFHRHPLPWYDYFRGLGAALYWAGYWVGGLQPEFMFNPLISWRLMLCGMMLIVIPSMRRLATFETDAADPNDPLNSEETR
jgi:hypothetical protein